MEIPTREQYENEIARLNSLITKAQEKYDYHYNKEMVSNQASTCPGMRGYCGGMTCCERFKLSSRQNWANMKSGLSSAINKAKDNLWNYQKAVAKAEQDAQVEAVRQAIADQVRLEQERIQQSQQNQIIMQEAPPAEPEPSATIEPVKSSGHSQILESDFKLPFHHNYLIPVIAIGGYLVLRH